MDTLFSLDAEPQPAARPRAERGPEPAERPRAERAAEPAERPRAERAAEPAERPRLERAAEPAERPRPEPEPAGPERAAPPAPARARRRSSKGIAPGDVVEVDRRGRRFFALVTSIHQRASGHHDLDLRPLDPRTTYFTATIREVVGVWRRAA